MLISRADAKSKGLVRYFTGQPCKHGHVSERQTTNGVCCSCYADIRHRHYHSDPEKGRTRARNWRASNPDAYRETYTRSYQNNQEKQLAKSRRWLSENRALSREQSKHWRRTNPARAAAHRDARRARTKKATPRWVDWSVLLKIYELCPKGHHVDHIIPLKHPDVCGLHVPWNLQYLPAPENLAKRNRLSLDLGVAYPNAIWP